MTSAEPNPGHAARRTAIAIAVLCLLNLALKVPLTGINRGEYTDGILQLLVFEVPSRLYPPLLGALAWALGHVGMTAETGARLVSAVAGSLAVIPVCLMARRLRPQAATVWFAGIFFTLSPLVLRWSVRVMTDSLFMALCAGSLYYVLETIAGPRARTDRARDDRNLALASFLAALSALARYQGAFLAPVLLVPAVLFVRRHRALPWRAALATLAWAALPAWIAWAGFAHGGQFADRSSRDPLGTALDYLNVLESFVYIAPYYVGLPIFAFFLFGAFYCDKSQPYTRAFLWIWGSWCVVILGLQSAFQSFQYRYMMPVLPGVLALAGCGCMWAEDWLAARRRGGVFRAAFIATILYMTMFSCAILVFQRETLGDQKAAALAVKEAFPADTPVFSNEQYGSFRNLECVKLSYWMGRPVKSIWPYLPPDGSRAPDKYMTGRCVLILGNVYGGDSAVDFITSQLNLYYHIRTAEAFPVTVVPVMDDVMTVPLFNQNPLAWVLRYKPQTFSTHVLVVESRRTPQEMADLAKRRMLPPQDPDKAGRQP